MGFSDYAEYDGLGLAKLVREGQVTPAELTEAAIERIERHDEALPPLYAHRGILWCH